MPAQKLQNLGEPSWSHFKKMSDFLPRGWVIVWQIRCARQEDEDRAPPARAERSSDDGWRDSWQDNWHYQQPVEAPGQHESQTEAQVLTAPWQMEAEPMPEPNEADVEGVLTVRQTLKATWSMCLLKRTYVTETTLKFREEFKGRWNDEPVEDNTSRRC